jgi:hypothetical protein
VVYTESVNGSDSRLTFECSFLSYICILGSSGGSVLAVTLLHAGTNLWRPLLAPKPTIQPASTAFIAENILIAVVLLVIYDGTTLTGRRSLSGS